MNRNILTDVCLRKTKLFGWADAVCSEECWGHIVKGSIDTVQNNVYCKFVKEKFQGPSWPWSYGIWIYNYLRNQCISPLMLWVRITIRVRCTTFCDKVCQWLATGRWFSQGPPVSSTNKTDRHDITETLLKVTLTITKQANKQ